MEIRVPLFLYHGANDPQISVTQSDRIAEYLQGAGKEVEYYRNPVSEHGFPDRTDEVAIYYGILSFLANNMGLLSVGH